MKKIKVGIVGCGFIGVGKHLPMMKQIEDVEVVAFCDIIVEKAEKSCKEFGTPDALVCTDYWELIAQKDINVVHVCTSGRSLLALLHRSETFGGGISKCVSYLYVKRSCPFWAERMFSWKEAG